MHFLSPALMSSLIISSHVISCLAPRIPLGPAYCLNFARNSWAHGLLRSSSSFSNLLPHLMPCTAPPLSSLTHLSLPRPSKCREDSHVEMESIKAASRDLADRENRCGYVVLLCCYVAAYEVLNSSVEMQYCSASSATGDNRDLSHFGRRFIPPSIALSIPYYRTTDILCLYSNPNYYTLE